MKKMTLLLTFVLVVSLGTLAHSAVTVPVPGVARADATGDIITPVHMQYAATITGVKVNPVGANKYFRLRNGGLTGDIIYETRTGSTTGTLGLDNVSFKLPSDGVYFETDDTGSNITIYMEQ